MVKNTSLPFVAILIVSLLFSCSSKKISNSNLEVNVTAFISNTDSIMGFGYIDVNTIKNKSQITEIPELKKVFEKTLAPIEAAVKLKDKVYYAFGGTLKDNGPQVNYVFLNVENTDSLQNLLGMLGFFFVKSKENSNVKIYYDESSALGFDDNTLVLVNTNFDEDPKELLLNAFTSFNKTKTDKNVAEILKVKNDILLVANLESLYANSRSLLKNLPEESGIEELVKGGYWTLGIDFNKGNLTAKMDISRVNDQLKELYPFKEKANEEIAQNLGLDSSQLAAALSLNMNHVDSLLGHFGEEQKQALFQLLYIPAVVKGIIAGQGLSGITNGNIGVMVSNKMDKEALLGIGLNNMHFFLGLGKDSENIIDLIETLAFADQIQDLGGGYYQIDQAMLRLEKNNLVYQTNKSSKEDFKTKSGKIEPRMEHFGEHPLSIYMSLQDEVKNKSMFGIPKSISELLNYANLQGDNDGFTLKIITKNEDVNVLKQLLDAYKQEVIKQVGNTPVYN